MKKEKKKKSHQIHKIKWLKIVPSLPYSLAMTIYIKWICNQHTQTHIYILRRTNNSNTFNKCFECNFFFFSPFLQSFYYMHTGMRMKEEKKKSKDHGQRCTTTNTITTTSYSIFFSILTYI